jgi:hypothetical protein
MKSSNDHYVPQFLLRRFTSEGKLQVFDKIERRTFGTNPKNVMAERGYNSVTLKDGAWIEFEDKFTYIENAAKPAFDKLIDRESVVALSPMEHASILTFLVVQHLRSRAIRDGYLSIGSHIRQKFPGFEMNELPDHFADEEFDKFAFLKSTLDDLASYTAPLIAKHMFLMKHEGGAPIYLSDNPMVMANTNDFGLRGNIGLGVPGIEIYLPISPTLILALYCPTLIDGLRRQIAEAESRRSALAAGLFRGNVEQQTRHAAAWGVVRKAVDEGKRHWRLMVEDRLVPMSADNLLYANSLQVRWAFRYLANQTGDFSFAERALSERADWSGHPTISVA